MDALSEEYATVAYDVRGHGRTGGSDRDAYSVDLFAADLDALVAELDLDRPVICGLSTGGCIAQVYAATRPDRLSGLVLADTFAPKLFDRREWLQRSVASFHETEIDFSAIDILTLVLYGEHEPPFVRRHAPKLGSEIPNASVRAVPGAGHASNLDEPAFFTDALREFLAEVRSAESETAPDRTVPDDAEFDER